MKKAYSILLSAFLVFNALFLGLPALTPVFAQNINQNIGIDCNTVNTESNHSLNVGCNADPGKLLGVIITAAFIIAALLALFFLIFGGIKWMLSGGNKEGTDAARKMITAAIIGLAIVFLSFVAIKILGAIFGFNINDLTLPSFAGALTNS